MSNPGAALAHKFKLTGNPLIDGPMLRVIAIASGILTSMILTWLNAKGYATTDIVFLGYTISPRVLIGGAVFSSLTGAIAFIWDRALSKINQARAIQAGANLVALGQALSTDGQTLIQVNGGSTPPLPVTTTTAPEIFKKLAPATVPKTN